MAERQERAWGVIDTISDTASGGMGFLESAIENLRMQASGITMNVTGAIDAVKDRAGKVKEGVGKLQEGKDLINEGVGGGE